MQRKTSPGPAEPGGTGGPLARPEFPRLNKVRLSKRARDDQGLIVLAFPNFCTLRLLCSHIMLVFENAGA